jgi:hypothetical protein
VLGAGFDGGMDCHRGVSQGMTRSHDAARDFPAIGDQNFLHALFLDTDFFQPHH